MWAIVPVKRFELAKGRLGDVLAADERHDLARAMLTDVLAALALARGVERTLVVTREPEVGLLARDAGAEVREETGDGLNAAVRDAATAAAAAGAPGVLVVHGDLPLVSAEDFEAMLARHGPAPALTLAPDERDDGTNCLAASPPELIEFRFGVASFPAHLAEGRRVGLEAAVVRRRGLAIDVDRLEDLRTVAGADAPGAAVAFLRSSGIASRVRAATAVAADGSGQEPGNDPTR